MARTTMQSLVFVPSQDRIERYRVSPYEAKFPTDRVTASVFDGRFWKMRKVAAVLMEGPFELLDVRPPYGGLPLYIPDFYRFEFLLRDGNVYGVAVLDRQLEKMEAGQTAELIEREVLYGLQKERR